MLPSFIVAGASKSGTTSLWRYLQAHPEVCMAVIKEVRFFTQKLPFYARGLPWYENLFASCSAAKARGEVSPVYMVNEDSPRLIKQTIPDVQVIFILRNPVDRMYSQFWFQRQLGIGTEHPNFDKMVRSRHPRIKGYLYANSYDIHLQRYQEYFDREQLSVFLYDDLRDTSSTFMQEVYKVIGVNPDFNIPNLGVHYNAARQPRAVGLQRFVSVFGRAIANRNYPSELHAPMSRLRKIIFNMITTDTQYPPMALESRQILVEEFGTVIDYVENYLARPLPLWRRIV